MWLVGKFEKLCNGRVEKEETEVRERVRVRALFHAFSKKVQGESGKKTKGRNAKFQTVERALFLIETRLTVAGIPSPLAARRLSAPSGKGPPKNGELGFACYSLHWYNWPKT